MEIFMRWSIALVCLILSIGIFGCSLADKGREYSTVPLQADLQRFILAQVKQQNAGISEKDAWAKTQTEFDEFMDERAKAAKKATSGGLHQFVSVPAVRGFVLLRNGSLRITCLRRVCIL